MNYYEKYLKYKKKYLSLKIQIAAGGDDIMSVRNLFKAEVLFKAGQLKAGVNISYFTTELNKLLDQAKKDSTLMLYWPVTVDQKTFKIIKN